MAAVKTLPVPESIPEAFSPLPEDDARPTIADSMALVPLKTRSVLLESPIDNLIDVDRVHPWKNGGYLTLEERALMDLSCLNLPTMNSTLSPAMELAVLGNTSPSIHNECDLSQNVAELCRRRHSWLDDCLPSTSELMPPNDSCNDALSIGAGWSITATCGDGSACIGQEFHMQFGDAWAWFGDVMLVKRGKQLILCRCTAVVQFPERLFFATGRCEDQEALCSVTDCMLPLEHANMLMEALAGCLQSMLTSASMVLIQLQYANDHSVVQPQTQLWQTNSLQADQWASVAAASMWDCVLNAANMALPKSPSQNYAPDLVPKQSAPLALEDAEPDMEAETIEEAKYVQAEYLAVSESSKSDVPPMVDEYARPYAELLEGADSQPIDEQKGDLLSDNDLLIGDATIDFNTSSTGKVNTISWLGGSSRQGRRCSMVSDACSSSSSELADSFKAPRELPPLKSLKRVGSSGALKSNPHGMEAFMDDGRRKSGRAATPCFGDAFAHAPDVESSSTSNAMPFPTSFAKASSIKRHRVAMAAASAMALDVEEAATCEASAGARFPKSSSFNQLTSTSVGNGVRGTAKLPPLQRRKAPVIIDAWTVPMSGTTQPFMKRCCA